MNASLHILINPKGRLSIFHPQKSVFVLYFKGKFIFPLYAHVLPQLEKE